MELRQLRYFVTVAEEGRFNRAADRLYIAAPSLSQQIKALENDLHVSLFDRGQRVELTPAGQALLQRARVILAEVELARADVLAADAARPSVTLRIAHLADLVLETTLRDFPLRHEGLQISVSSSRGDDALQAVRQGRADAAVVWSRGRDERDLEGAVLCSVPFGVVLPSGHRAASFAAAVPVSALADEVLIMFPREPFAGIWDRTVDHFFPRGTEPHQVLVEPNLLNAPEALLRAVASGAGIAAGIIGLTERFSLTGTEMRALDPGLWLDLEVVWRAPARAPARRVVDILLASVLDMRITP